MEDITCPPTSPNSTPKSSPNSTPKSSPLAAFANSYAINYENSPNPYTEVVEKRTRMATKNFDANKK